jgi:hypothetical protein
LGTRLDRAAIFGLALAAALHCTAAIAQAWLPREGSLGFSLDYTNVLNKHHYNSRGERDDIGHTRTHSAYLSGSYSPSDRWMLFAGLPYVRTSYEGDFAHFGSEVDDHGFHDAVTDLRLEVHYQAIDGPFALAPFAAVVIPVTDYETMGHAAPGRGLYEGWIGTYIGASLDEWLPRTYVQLRLNYAFVEKVAGISHDRINADAEIGYFINPALSVRLVGMWQDTDGGIGVPIPRSHPLYHYHDQLAATRYFNLGGGVAWSISERVHTYLFYSSAIRGRNAHMVDQSVSVGVNFIIGL